DLDLLANVLVADDRRVTSRGLASRGDGAAAAQRALTVDDAAGRVDALAQLERLRPSWGADRELLGVSGQAILDGALVERRTTGRHRVGRGVTDVALEPRHAAL